MVPVELIFLSQGLFEACLGFIQITEECLYLFVELFVTLRREQVDEMVVDLLAQLSGRFVITILAVEDVTQHGGGVLASVEGILHAESLVQLIQ